MEMQLVTSMHYELRGCLFDIFVCCLFVLLYMSGTLTCRLSREVISSPTLHQTLVILNISVLLSLCTIAVLCIEMHIGNVNLLFFLYNYTEGRRIRDMYLLFLVLLSYRVILVYFKILKSPKSGAIYNNNIIIIMMIRILQLRPTICF